MSRNPDMDFPGQCLTNVHRIDNCGSIRYNVYALHETESSESYFSPAFPHPLSPYPDTTRQGCDDRKVADLSHDVELELRAQGKIVASDVEGAELWWFDFALDRGLKEGEPVINGCLPLEDEITIGRARLKKICEETLTSSSLDQGCQSKTSSARSGKVQSPSIHVTSSDHPPSAEASAQTRERTFLAYKLFITAIISAISYSFAKHYRYIPVNFRTFILPSYFKPLRLFNPNGFSTRPPDHVTLVSLDARLTATGKLIISTRTDARPGTPKWFLFDGAHAGDDDKELILAPGGRKAWYRAVPLTAKYPASPAYAESPASGIFWNSGIPPRNRPSLAWRHHVQSWLAWNGLDVPGIDDPDSWIEVEINAPRDEFSEASPTSGGSKTCNIFWPACLSLVVPHSSCWQRPFPRTKPPTGTSDTLASGQETRSTLIATELHMADPLAFAEEWYLKGTERKEIFKRIREEEEAKQAEKAQAEIVPSQQTRNITATGASVQSGNPVDLPHISGVYPTPPDNLLLHGNPKASFTEKPTGSLHHLVENSAKDDDLSTSMAHANEHQPTDEIEGTASQLDTQMSGLDNDVGDDLFGDMDDEMFGENDVTEADFSFFDDPTMDGIENANSAPLESQELQEGMSADAGQPPDSNFNQSDQDKQNLGHDTDPIIPESQIQHSEPKIAAESKSKEGFEGVEEANDNHGAEVHENRPQAPSPPSTAELPADGVSTENENAFISPPLSPSDVVKKLLPVDHKTQPLPESTDDGEVFPRGEEHDKARKPSIFDPVNFSQRLHLHDHKYNLEGRFGFVNRTEDRSRPKDDKASPAKNLIPNIGLPKHRRRAAGPPSSATVRSAEAIKSPAFPRDKAQGKHDETASKHEKLEKSEILESDHEDSSSSEEGDGETAEYELGTKRKRLLEDDGDDAATSSLQRLAFSSVADDMDIDEPLPITCKALEAHSDDSSLRGYSLVSQLEGAGSVFMNKKNFIAIAQIFADQITWGIHKVPRDEHYNGSSQEETPASALQDEKAARALTKVCVNAERCDLATYASIQDLLPEMPMIGRVHIRPNIRRTATGHGEAGASSLAKKNVFSIPPPHVRLYRQDTAIEILPSALHFWEIFGLGPASGPKDVVSYCIFPPGEGVAGAVDTFLTRLGTAYESCKLGKHDKGAEFQKNQPGLVPIGLAGHKPVQGSGVEKELEVTCRKLGSFLPDATEDSANIVIYLVNNNYHPNAVVNLCGAAYLLFQAYIHALQAKQKKTFNELVLQIIPMDFIASPTALIVPTQAEYAKVALEVYNRCAPNKVEDEKTGPTQHAPSILLAEKPPRAIEFRLTTDPSPSLLMENTCMHMAYSVSYDGRWVSAAWSDSFGKYQTNVAYCLARRRGLATPFADIVREIWETTLQIVQTKRVTWRFIFVKDGLMDRDEVEMWTSLAAQPSQPPFHLTLFDTDGDPDLFIRPPPVPAPIPTAPLPSANPQTVNSYTTPASTPQNSTLSPDQFGTTVGTPATPNTSVGPASSDTNTATAAAATSTATTTTDSVEPDTTLVDVTDEAWGVLLSHRLNNSSSLVEYNPAIASAYLVRRTSIDESQPLDVLAINLLYISQPVRGGNECLMREMLSTYRGLGVLARHKSMFNPGDKILPWHLATAIKAQRALSSLL